MSWIDRFWKPSLADTTEQKRRNDTWEQLWQLYRRDFSAFRAQLTELYGDKAGDMVEREIPLVWRMARELATLYLRPPSRSWVSRATGRPLERAQSAIAASIYRGARVNAAMARCQEQAIVLGSGTTWVWPSPAGIRLLNPPPHHQKVELDDPLGDDPRDVATWWVRLPVGTDASTGVVHYGVARITRTEARWEKGPDKIRGNGVWQEDGSNPFGRIPVVLARTANAAPGTVFADPPEDLLDANLALCHDHTDLAHVARLQSYGQGVLASNKPQTWVDEVRGGPGTWIAVPEGAELSFENATPPLGPYREVSEAYTRALLGAYGMHTGGLVKSTGLTALAKQLELVDRDIERLRMVDTFHLLERDLWRLVRRVRNALDRSSGGDGLLLADSDVRVEYREPVSPVDRLHDTQAMAIEIQHGLTSAPRIIAAREGMDLAAAEEHVRKNLRSSAELRQLLDPDGRVDQARNPGAEPTRGPTRVVEGGGR